MLNPVALFRLLLVAGLAGFAAARAAELPGRVLVTVGTVTRIATNAPQAYLFLNDADPAETDCPDCPPAVQANTGALPAGDTGYVAVYSKDGPATSTNTFTRRSVLTRATDGFTLNALLRRSQIVGESVELLDERLTTLFGPLVPAGNIGTAEKVSAVIRGSVGHPDYEQNLRLLARQHPGLAMCLGLAEALPIPAAAGATTTFELRRWNTTTQQDGAVIGRTTVRTGAPLELPAPFAPVVVPDASAKGDLNVKLRWAMTDDLKRVAIASQGFDLFRVARTRAETLGWHVAPPTAAALAVALAQTPQSVARVNEQPVLVAQVLSRAEATNVVADAKTAYLTDDNDRHDPGGVPFTDGSEFYYFVGARDLLGRLGGLSPGTMVRLCDRIAPPPPREVRVNALHLWDGTAAKDRFEITWKPNARVGTETPAAYYVYRWNSPTAMQSPTAKLATPVGGPIPHVPATERYAWRDDTAQSPTALADAGKQFWYTVRAADDGACGPNLSGDSAPGVGVLRDRFGPAAPSGVVKIRCAVPKVYPNDESRLLDGGASGRFASFKFICTRTNDHLVAAKFFVRYRAGFAEFPLAEVGFDPLKDKAVLETTLLRVTAEQIEVGCRVRTREGTESGVAWESVQTPADNFTRTAKFDAQLFLDRIVADDDCALHLPPRPGTPGAKPGGGSANNDPGTIDLTITLPPAAAEYRLYRCLDGGPKSLIATGPAQGSVDFSDGNLPVNSGVLCYFVQTFDANGNPSPLVRLDPPIALAGVLPAPQLHNLTGAGVAPLRTNVPALAPRMNLQWTCAEPGVDRFEVWVADATGNAVLNPGLELTFAGVQLGYLDEVNDGVGADGDYTLFVTPRLATGFGSNGVFTASCFVTPGREYTVFVRALGLDGTRGPAGNARKFTWQMRSTLPLASGVPWPARELPSLNPNFNSNLEARLLTEGEFIGVGVKIGQLVFDLPMERSVLNRPYAFLLEDSSSIEPFLFTDFRGSNVLACVLFREQVPNNRYPVVSGDVIQVSPLLESIAYRLVPQTIPVPAVTPPAGGGRGVLGLPTPPGAPELAQGATVGHEVGGTTNAPPAGTPIIELTDPFIVLGTDQKSSVNTLESADIYLKDTQPVVAGARYRYVLARFKANHELEQLIPVGEVEVFE